jgi:small nuclear ribonucleoprotein (snRNP)-like protein
MERKVAITLAVFLFCLLYTAAIAAQDRTRSSQDSEAARAEINRLGFGKRVNVKLQNGSKARGRITAFADDHFVLTDNAGKALKFAYADVARITKQSEKLRIFEKPFAAIMVTAAFVGTFVVLTMEYFR